MNGLQGHHARLKADLGDNRPAAPDDRRMTGWATVEDVGSIQGNSARSRLVQLDNTIRQAVAPNLLSQFLRQTLKLGERHHRRSLEKAGEIGGEAATYLNAVGRWQSGGLLTVIKREGPKEMLWRCCSGRWDAGLFLELNVGVCKFLEVRFLS